MLKHVGTYLGGALIILFSLGWMIEWAMMGIWILPLILFLAYSSLTHSSRG